MGQLTIDPTLGLLLVVVAGCQPPAASQPAVEASPAPRVGAALVVADTEPPAPDGRDWPDFLGPHRNGKSPETGLLTQWPPTGPPVLWTRALGTGYGIGSIAAGKLYQLDRVGKMARLVCLDAATGREYWQYTYPSTFEDLLGYDDGPRSSPVVDGDRVYLCGAEGQLHCLRTDDGKLLWNLDTQAKYGVVQNFFGVGSTPLVEGDLLIMNVGGSPPDSPEMYSGRVQGNGTGVVAFDKRTGEEKYRLSDELASYASPVAATIDGRRWCFVFARGGLLGFEPRSGKLAFHFPWRSKLLESVNASTPVVIGNRVFISETYGPGSAMLQVRPGACDVVWSDADRRRDKSLMAHWNTPIHHAGYLYGCSGRHTAGAELRCIDAASGEVRWSQPGLTRTSLLYVEEHLIALSEDGTLRQLRATPERYDPQAEVVLRDASYERLLRSPAWAAPILADGRLYLRGKGRLICLDLRRAQ